MRPSEKLNTDLDRAFRGIGAKNGSANNGGAQNGGVNNEVRQITKRFVDTSLGFIPLAARTAAVDSFLPRYAASPDKALQWLGALCSIFLQDYDDSPMTRADWEDIRDILTEGADDMDIDILSYAMGLVVEQGAL